MNFAIAATLMVLAAKPLASIAIDYARIDERVGKDFVVLLDFNCRAENGVDVSFWAAVIPFGKGAKHGSFAGQRITPFFDSKSTISCSLKVSKTNATIDSAEIQKRREVLAAACDGTIATAGDIMGPCLGSRTIQLPTTELAKKKPLILPMVKIEIPDRHPVMGAPESWVGVRLFTQFKSIPEANLEIGATESAALNSVSDALRRLTKKGGDKNEFERNLQLLRFLLPSRQLIMLPEDYFRITLELGEAIGKIHNDAQVRGSDIEVAEKRLSDAVLALDKLQRVAPDFVPGFDEIRVDYCRLIYQAFVVLTNACATQLPEPELLNRMCGWKKQSGACNHSWTSTPVAKAVVARFRFGLRSDLASYFYKEMESGLSAMLPEATMSSVDGGIRIVLEVPTQDCRLSGALRGACEERVSRLSYRIVVGDSRLELEESWWALVGGIDGGRLEAVTRVDLDGTVLESLAVFPKTSILSRQVVAKIRRAAYLARVRTHAFFLSVRDMECPEGCVGCNQLAAVRKVLNEKLAALSVLPPPTERPCSDELGQAEVDLESAVLAASEARKTVEVLLGSLRERCVLDGG